MKYILPAVLAVALSGCDYVYDEIYEPGGFREHALGPEFGQAHGLAARADRYLMVSAVVASMAMESSQFGAIDTAPIDAMNALYDDLSKLYVAAYTCNVDTTCALTVPAPSAFAFEATATDVQADLTRLAKHILIDLNLDLSVDDVLSLDVFEFFKVLRKAAIYIPVLRTGAAAYRDSVYSYAVAKVDGCEDTNKDCKDLTGALVDGTQFADPANDGVLRYYKGLLSAADRVDGDWSLNTPQRLGLIYHLTAACDAYTKKLPKEVVEGAEGKKPCYLDDGVPGPTPLKSLITTLEAIPLPT